MTVPGTSLLGTIAFLALANASVLADDAEIAFSKQTEAGHYHVTIGPATETIPIAERHAWTVELADSEGAPIIPTQLVFYGGMRAHGHGFPSTPQVTRQVEPGTYLVEGVVFNMHGDWEIVVGIGGPSGPDKALFHLAIQPPVQQDNDSKEWTPEQVAMMQSLVLGEATPRKRDPSNRFDGRPDAISLGRSLFFDAGLSLNRDISCATCHEPERYFTDAKKRSMGSKELKRNSPTVVGAAHGDWFYWDGRRDSLWSQALTPIETPGEMDNNRLALVRYVATNSAYSKPFLEVFGELPALEDWPASAGPYGSDEDRSAWSALGEEERRTINHAFASVGKIIASYVATLEPEPSRFDRYAASIASGNADETLLSASELRGLRLFLDPQKTQCLRCHNGPHFTNFGFNNIGTGIGSEGDVPDFGRMVGLRAALLDEFNCVGRYSDAAPDECGHHRFAAQNHADNGAFKVPGLRDVARTGPYMHDGRFATLREVLEFYRDPPPRDVSNHELPPLELSDEELDDLANFLASLTGIVSAP